jgi:ribonuclease P protein component
LRFPREQRLTRGADLTRVRLEGKRMRTATLEVRVTASPRGIPRVGFVIAKHGGGSVERNRLKRRLRELVRLRWLLHLGPVDLVVRSLPGANRLAWPALVSEFESLERDVLRRYGAASAS